MYPSKFVMILLLATLGPACSKPKGEWTIKQGVDFHDENVAQVVEGVTRAGEVVQFLGVPYRTQEDRFVYAVQRVRPINRDWLLFSQAFVQRVTVKTTVIIKDGVADHVETTRTDEMIKPQE
jgi:outer membrane protein assembly factor BamE (lipoprotein component of BamABCDE complex)